jgi:polar amino acid transport system substrate-binding protein
MKVASLLASLLAAFTLTCAASASAQTVKIGTTPSSSPFAYLNTKTNQVEGLMIDIAKATTQAAGLTPEFEPMAFASLIPSLTTKRVDMVSAGMFITPVRKEVVDFTTPVFRFGEGLVDSKKDTTPYTALADLKGKRVGAAIGTSMADMLQENASLFSEIKLYDNSVDLFTDVNNGRIDMGVIDFPIAVTAEKSGNYPNLQVVHTYKTTAANDVGMPVRKGDTALLNKLNTAIAKIKADGTLDGIYKKWGLQ